MGKKNLSKKVIAGVLGASALINYANADILEVVSSGSSGFGADAAQLIHQSGAQENGTIGADDSSWSFAPQGGGTLKRSMKVSTKPYGTDLRIDARPQDSETPYRVNLSIYNSTNSTSVMSVSTNRIRFRLTEGSYNDGILRLGKLSINSSNRPDNLSINLTTNLNSLIENGTLLGDNTKAGYFNLGTITNVPHNQIYGTIDVSEVSTNRSFTTGKNLPLAIDLSNNLFDGITYVVTRQPNGFLEGSVPQVTFRPATNSLAADSFDVQLRDPSGNVLGNMTYTVGITNVIVNSSPVASSQSYFMRKNGEQAFTFQMSDADAGDLLVPEILSKSEGSQILTNGSTLSFKPAQGFTGLEQIVFRAFDGADYSAPATNSFYITNTAPATASVSFAGRKNHNLSFSFPVSDADGDSLSIALDASALPIHSSVQIDGTNTLVTPAAGFAGNDSFNYIVNDGDSSVTNQVSLQFTNDAPVIAPFALSTVKNVGTNGLVFASDANNDPVEVTIVQGMTNGLSYLTNTSQGLELRVEPAFNFYGGDAVTLAATDGSSTNYLIVPVQVDYKNYAPFATNGSYVLGKNQMLSIVPQGMDPDGDAVTFDLVNGPTNGVLSIDNGNWMYKANSNFVGQDNLEFKVKDTNGLESTVAQISLDITNINNKPFAYAGSYICNENGSTEGRLQGTDVDGDTLNYLVTRQPVNGKVSLNNSNFIYHADRYFNGTDSFTYQVFDGNAYSDEQEVSLTILPGPISTPSISILRANVTGYDLTVSGVQPRTYVVPEFISELGNISQVMSNYSRYSGNGTNLVDMTFTNLPAAGTSGFYRARVSRNNPDQ